MSTTDPAAPTPAPVSTAPTRQPPQRLAREYGAERLTSPARLPGDAHGGD